MSTTANQDGHTGAVVLKVTHHCETQRSKVVAVPSTQKQLAADPRMHNASKVSQGAEQSIRAGTYRDLRGSAARMPKPVNKRNSSEAVLQSADRNL